MSEQGTQERNKRERNKTEQAKSERPTNQRSVKQDNREQVKSAVKRGKRSNQPRRGKRTGPADQNTSGGNRRPSGKKSGDSAGFVPEVKQHSIAEVAADTARQNQTGSGAAAKQPDRLTRQKSSQGEPKRQPRQKAVERQMSTADEQTQNRRKPERKERAEQNEPNERERPSDRSGRNRRGRKRRTKEIDLEKIKAAETFEDIRKDNERLEKEIWLDIAAMRNVKIE